jgi:hypothetical protein
MPKRTFASVTQRRCKCGTLERYAAQGDKPILFDKRTNEFSFRYPTEYGDAQIVIYHCPFCGGATPRSTRDKLFAVVSDTEAHRLNELLSDINTIDEAIQKFGLPDNDFRGGTRVTHEEKDGNPPTTNFYRRVVYRNLSDTTEVHLTDYNRERVDIELQGKYLA